MFISRMIRAAKLDARLYEEVEADRGAVGQAAAVVVLSSIAAGFAYIGTTGLSGIIIRIIIALAGWLLWACLTYVVGTRILPEPQTKSDLGELLRTIGYSSSAGLIRVFGIIPGLGKPLFFIAAIWMMIAMIIAVRQALDYKSTGRAAAVCIISWIIQFVIMALFLSVFVDTAARPL